MAEFPQQRSGVFYLAEGGQETEIMYKFGYELPEFAIFTLLDKPDAVVAMQGMYRRYLDTVARHGFNALVGGLDYRARPDWGGLLGYSPSDLAEIQLRSIDFLREVAKPYDGQIPEIRVVGIIGPRGDAYSLNKDITAEEAKEYHSFQLETLRKAKVDLVSAMTFNNVSEALGLARAAASFDLPLSHPSRSITITGLIPAHPYVKLLKQLTLKQVTNDLICTGLTVPIRWNLILHLSRETGSVASAASGRMPSRWTKFSSANWATQEAETRKSLGIRWDNLPLATRILTYGADAVAHGKSILTKLLIMLARHGKHQADIERARC